MPAIEACIPTYNESRTTAQVLRSLSEQTHNFDQIYVIDGGSTDDTREIARSAGADVIDQRSDGVAGARNEGLEVCSTPYFATIDADAVLAEEWAETTLEILESEPEVAAVGAEIVEAGPSRSARWRERHMPFASREDDGPIDHLPGNNMLFRTDALEEVGGWNESYPFGNEDIDLCERLRDAGYEIWYTRETSVEHYGAKGLELPHQLWRWHTPDGGPDRLTSVAKRIPVHVGKALTYASEDLRDGLFWAVLLDLSVAPIHTYLDFDAL